MREPQIYTVVPVPAPRMTRSDKWKKRPIVMRYFAYRDELKKAGAQLPNQPCKLTFYIGMPDSWSKKKKAAMNGMPHEQTPDIDNLTKGFLDAIFEQDKQVWSIWIEKRWSETPHIAIEKLCNGL